jgi:hypothetical protein
LGEDMKKLIIILVVFLIITTGLFIEVLDKLDFPGWLQLAYYVFSCLTINIFAYILDTLVDKIKENEESETKNDNDAL